MLCRAPAWGVLHHQPWKGMHTMRASAATAGLATPTAAAPITKVGTHPLLRDMVPNHPHALQSCADEAAPQQGLQDDSAGAGPGQCQHPGGRRRRRGPAGDAAAEGHGLLGVGAAAQRQPQATPLLPHRPLLLPPTSQKPPCSHACDLCSTRVSLGGYACMHSSSVAPIQSLLFAHASYWQLVLKRAVCAA